MTGAAFRVVAIGVMLGAAVFLLAPLAIIAAASFSPTPVFDLPVGGASLRWYARGGFARRLLAGLDAVAGDRAVVHSGLARAGHAGGYRYRAGARCPARKLSPPR